ncbi:hypothetical protein BJ912DRAFT_1108814 [Pholiota molesta]|nr:hypothetical protein BJ912DRAFT_1108814 [Pholiota molesta]
MLQPIINVTTCLGLVRQTTAQIHVTRVIRAAIYDQCTIAYSLIRSRIRSPVVDPSVVPFSFRSLSSSSDATQALQTHTSSAAKPPSATLRRNIRHTSTSGPTSPPLHTPYHYTHPCLTYQQHLHGERNRVHPRARGGALDAIGAHLPSVRVRIRVPGHHRAQKPSSRRGLEDNAPSRERVAVESTVRRAKQRGLQGKTAATQRPAWTTTRGGRARDIRRPRRRTERARRRHRAHPASVDIQIARIAVHAHTAKQRADPSKLRRRNDDTTVTHGRYTDTRDTGRVTPAWLGRQRLGSQGDESFGVRLRENLTPPFLQLWTSHCSAEGSKRQRDARVRGDGQGRRCEGGHGISEYGADSTVQIYKSSPASGRKSTCAFVQRTNEDASPWPMHDDANGSARYRNRRPSIPLTNEDDERTERSRCRWENGALTASGYGAQPRGADPSRTGAIGGGGRRDEQQRTDYAFQMSVESRRAVCGGRVASVRSPVPAAVQYFIDEWTCGRVQERGNATRTIALDEIE